ncbi:MAG: transglutaminase-like domain-containing protein, partial [Fidelibacterota bacterium]
KQGDAGIKTFLFMTLCRYNKIPARLVSGWQFQPPTKSLHDWCEIYLEPYGWVPVDVTYGIQDSKDEDLKYFYLGNIDSYRLVFNRDYGTEFKPEKEYFRSDRIDNQRGEIETMDENLYFDKWDWNVEFDIVSTYK